MKYPAAMFALICALSLGPSGVRSQATMDKLTTVPSVDLDRYAGRWYEIARYPNRFEKDCIRNVTADYALQPNGRIRVTNTCVVQSGKQKVAAGEAKVDDKRTNAKLKVRFAASFLSWLPFVWGEYWIIDLDSNYRYALVGDSGRDYFWILSRDAQMSDDLYASLLKRAEAKGFNPAKVKRVQQTW